MTNTEYELSENRMIWGWKSIDDVAGDVWSGIHNILLEGELVFAYKSGEIGEKLKQIVIVKNLTLDPGYTTRVPNGTYGVGYVTSTYTALLPSVPIRYLTDEISQYLTEWKIDKTIQNTYKAIVEDLEKNG